MKDRCGFPAKTNGCSGLVCERAGKTEYPFWNDLQGGERKYSKIFAGWEEKIFKNI
ncbi:MAG: hypothetical protein LUC83_05160 [Clostridiales bacterium]|nr:hypothetical protein [Clostridiales bacterium]